MEIRLNGETYGLTIVLEGIQLLLTPSGYEPALNLKLWEIPFVKGSYIL